MSKNVIYGMRVQDHCANEEDHNFIGFLIVDGKRLTETEEPIQHPEDKLTDQEFITNFLTTKREEFIHQAYVCGVIETKKVSEWFKSL
jgi:hypothetical protein